ncbi:Uncharacterized conserved protein YndB, AHSA1/START domain [Devosia enhydra]|uniref:Uncharacterized conserved protein YndB, AHSA1/START domain n=1 Tax=Devosia enhydra TaxID=665118 RepID=A0A1K2HVW0_9HYPH|nr:SRPBCC domain-containing protein [Devosia enhydra]SFZ82766.1 Uncharacterized conserved protein YndB, AHSA1/START domain [Devosia enhydra]
MLANAERSTPAQTIAIDRQAHTITLWRRFAASPAKVFAAWTEPDHVRMWWDPSGAPLARCEIDLRIGGGFAFVPAGQPHMPFTGVYKEIAAPDTLVFDANGALGRVTLDDRDGGTLMTVCITCGSDEHLDMYLKLGIDVGTARTMDNLVSHVDRLAA